MTARARITKAEMERAIKAARAVDASAIVEIVTNGITLRILPGESVPRASINRENSCDNAFGAKG